LAVKRNPGNGENIHMYIMARSRRMLPLAIVSGILIMSWALRMGGLWRGIDAGMPSHPDEAKQVRAVEQYLRGNLIFYAGNLFYDGYPYGLNCVDAVILKPLLAVRAGWARLTNPAETPIPEPSLTAWVRGLRVFYGILVIGLGMAIVRRMDGAAWRMWLAGLLMAMAPVSVAVAHSATGDMGVDLLVSVMLLILVATVHGSLMGLLPVAGLAAGMAYACKYNGLLAVLAIGVYGVLEAVRTRRVRPMITSLAGAVGGFLAGVVLLTPGFLLDPKVTWRNMVANLAFIRDYDASEAVLAMPWLQQVARGFTNQMPRLVSGLGWGVTLLAIIGLLVAMVDWWRIRQATASDEPAGRMATLRVAVLVFPFLALGISVATKPEVQPFHFSYLQLPLVIGAVSGCAALARRGRFPALVAGAILLLEVTPSALVEHWFWTRPDNVQWHATMVPTLFNGREPAVPGREDLRNLTLEGNNVPVFRNRHRVLRSEFVGDWRRIQQAPVPTVPYPRDDGWIFLNGPVFPRNDRLFKVDADTVRRKDLAFHGPPGSLSFGFRTASYPAWIELECGGFRCVTNLPAQSQVTVMAGIPRTFRAPSGMTTNPPVSFATLTVKVQGGDAWVEVLADARQQMIFDWFGGIATPPEADVLPRDAGERLDMEVQRCRFVDENPGHAMELDAVDTERFRVCWPDDAMVLPAGSYMVEAWLNAERGTTVDLALEAYPKGVWEPIPVLSFDGAGKVRIGARFTKPYAPYRCRIVATCRTGRARIHGLSVRPDTARLVHDLNRWRETGGKPVWLKRVPDGEVEPVPAWDRQVQFENGVRPVAVKFPDDMTAGQRLRLTCELVPGRDRVTDLNEQVVFIHLLQGGKQVAALQFPLMWAFESAGIGRPLELAGVEGLSPGEYDVRLGVYSMRTRKRWAITGQDADKRECRERRMVIGKTRVLP